MSVLAALRPVANAMGDAGSPEARWHAVHLYYVRVGSAYVEPYRLARKSTAVYNTTAQLLYMAVVNGRWAAVELDARLPDPTWLDNDTFAAVIDGLWGYEKSEYALPPVWDNDDYLIVDGGQWLSTPLDIVLPPAVTVNADGYLLMARDGEWVLADGENFYLPTLDVMTPEVRHVVTVCAGRWLVRPFDEVSEGMNGLLSPVPGDSTVALCGDGAWRDIDLDYGNLRVGDTRRALFYDANVWVPLDGGTLGKTGTYSDVKYLPLYRTLDPNAQWDGGDLVTLPSVPGMQVRYTETERHPTDLVLHAGYAAEAPYVLEMSRDPNFIRVDYRTSSEEDVHNWLVRDKSMFCYLGGVTCEHYSGAAEVVVPSSTLEAGFYHIRITNAVGVRFDSVCVTENDLARLPSLVSAGTYPSGSTARTAPFRQQIYTVNGRGIHLPNHAVTVGVNGVALQGVGRVNAAANALVLSYGVGDMGKVEAVSKSSVMRQLLEQLADLDGYSPNVPVPKCKLVPLGFVVGRGNWFGGMLGVDGKLYFVPHSANTMLVFNPKTGTFSTWGALGGVKFKWAGGVSHPNGKMYCMPYMENSVLVVDPRQRTMTKAMFGLPTSELSKGQWLGACMTTDNRILSVTSSTTDVEDYGFELELFPDEGKARVYDLGVATTTRFREGAGSAGLPLKERHPWNLIRGYAGFDRDTLPFLKDVTAFGGLGMSATGVPVTVPCGTWIVEAARSEYARYREDKPNNNPVPYRDLIYWSIYRNEWGKLDNAEWYSGGQIVFDSAAAMSAGYNFGKYDYTKRTLTQEPGEYQRVPYAASAENIFLRSKFLSGVLAPDGNTYFLPCDGKAPVVGVRAPDGSMSSFRVSDPRYAYCRGGVLGPDGNIYSACADGTAAFALNPRTRTLRIIETGHRKLPERYTAWMGCVAGPDGRIYYPPFDSEYMLVVDPCVPCNAWRAELNGYINKF